MFEICKSVEKSLSVRAIPRQELKTMQQGLDIRASIEKTLKVDGMRIQIGWDIQMGQRLVPVTL